MMNKTFIGCVILVFTTLQAFYFRSISLAPFPLLSLLLIIAVTPKTKFNVYELQELLLFSTIVAISVMLGVINLNEIGDTIFYLPTLVGWLLFPIGVIYFKRYFRYYKENLQSIFKWVLVLHVSFFFIQFLSYKLFHVKFDFIEIITGESQRTGATKLKGVGGDNIRAAGLFSEPGSYTVYIYILLVFNLILENKFKILSLLALISMFLSFSMTGILMAIVVILLFVSNFKLSKKQILNLVYVALGVTIFLSYNSELFLGPIYDRFMSLGNDASAEARFQSGIEQFLYRNFLYSGLGIGVQIANIKSTSALLGTLFNFGIVNFIVFIFICLIKIYRAEKNSMHCILLVPILMSNIALNQIIFVCFLSFMILPKRKTTR